ncbi:MAG TPA: hypothetical protein VFZ32_04280 [Micromonosporaceae bacterium]
MVVADLGVRVVLAAAVALAAAGCGTTPQTGVAESPTSAPPSISSGAEPSAGPSRARRPVAAAGGVCKLLSYGLVAASTRVDFDTAAAGRNACALQVYGHAYPSLTLAVSATKADAKTFQKAVPPDGAPEVDGLGEAAYRAIGRTAGRAGPSAEVGWLNDGKIYILRYVFERGASRGQAGQMSARLVGLAKRIKPPS